MITATSRRSASSRKVSMSSLMSSSERALRFSGRLSVTVAMRVAGSCSVRTIRVVLAVVMGGPSSTGRCIRLRLGNRPVRPGRGSTRHPEQPRWRSVKGMADVTLLHNPRCSTSRAALAEVEAASVDAEVVRYLTKQLQQTEVRYVTDKQEVKDIELVR